MKHFLVLKSSGTSYYCPVAQVYPHLYQLLPLGYHFGKQHYLHLTGAKRLREAPLQGIKEHMVDSADMPTQSL